MTGVVTKKHIILIAREFGWRKALRVLVSRKPVALKVLMMEEYYIKIELSVIASCSPIAMALPFYYPHFGYLL